MVPERAQSKAPDLRALARHAGFTDRYVGKVFPCAFLAPDIVESILQGRQPDDLTLARLSREIPPSWPSNAGCLGSHLSHRDNRTLRNNDLFSSSHGFRCNLVTDSEQDFP